MRLILAILLLSFGSAASAQEKNLAQDAQGLERLINERYAYLDRLPGNRFELTPPLRDEARTVETRQDLIRFAERALSLLADHHAITGASLRDSWAVFPSYGDLWIEQHSGAYHIEQVRADSPAWVAGIRAGDRLVGVGGTTIDEAVADYWADLGTTENPQRNAFAARVLAAGRRDRPRSLLIRQGAAPPRLFELPNLYATPPPDAAPLTVRETASTCEIRFNNSLGNEATIAAFDAAMAVIGPDRPLVLDLTDTPSGGNTTVARAIMGWFVTQPTGYQMHRLPLEERRTGVARQWIEQVLPRSDRHHVGPVTVRVGRWTGSMGEGLAIGMAAIGARVEGTRMAGLLGAISDHRLSSELVVKLPTERLSSVDGVAREDFVPAPPLSR